MAGDWNERDHPRDGEGKFRDKVGSSGWAQRISDSIGSGHSEVQPRAGTFIGNVPETHGNARPMDEPPGFDALPDDDNEPGAKIIDAMDLLLHADAYKGGGFEVYNPESGEWAPLHDVYNDERGGVEYLAVSTKKDAGVAGEQYDGFTTSIRPDPDEEYDDGEFEELEELYDEDERTDISIRRRRPQ